MNKTAPDGWHLNGPHLYRFEPPNVYMSRSRGDIRAEHMRRTFDLLQERVDAVGPIYWISNVSEIGKVSTEAQKVQNAGGREHNPNNLLAMLIVGSTFHKRVMIQLAIKANRLLRGDRSPLRIKFFDSEDEALKWVAADRLQQSAH